MSHLCVTEILHEVFILLCVDIFNFSLSLLFLGHYINSLCFYITDSAIERRGLRALKMIPCIFLCWYLLSFVFSFLFLSSNVNSLRLNIADSEMETIWHMSDVFWASSWHFGTYHMGDQWRLRRACTSVQSRQSLRCSSTWGMEVDNESHKKSNI